MCHRTELVEVTDSDLKALAGFKAFPYKGKSPKDFVGYTQKLLQFAKDLGDAEFEAMPTVAQNIFHALAGEDKTVEQAWTEAEEPIPTSIVALDDGGRLIPGAEVSNGNAFL